MQNTITLSMGVAVVLGLVASLPAFLRARAEEQAA